MLPSIDGLTELLARMAALEIGSADRIPVQKAWREMRRKLEREFAKSEYPDGELYRVERLIYAEPAFANFNRVRKTVFERSPQGKAKRKVANAKHHAKRSTPEYRERKRLYDQQRYQRRKAQGGRDA